MKYIGDVPCVARAAKALKVGDMVLKNWSGDKPTFSRVAGLSHERDCVTILFVNQSSAIPEEVDANQDDTFTVQVKPLSAVMGDVRAGDVIQIDSDYPPRRVKTVEPLGENEVFVSYQQSGGHRYHKRLKVKILERGPKEGGVTAYVNAFDGTQKLVTDLTHFITGALSGGSSEGPESYEKVRASWRELKELMRKAGLDDE